VKTMSRLSDKALECLTAADGAVRALTDVTGFALAGHAHEIAHGSGVTIRIDWKAVPVLPGVEHYARKGQITGGAERNREFYGRWMRFERKLENWQDEVLFDPQTSGGLLAAVDPEQANAILAVFESTGEPVARIGEVVEGESGALVIA
ncbi:MAG: AIR synthase-related protein, partial [Acidobacteriota bacterium]|nr:AIR synthase-related protein [Acidobacteriota bacterium]